MGTAKRLSQQEKHWRKQIPTSLLKWTRCDEVVSPAWGCWTEHNGHSAGTSIFGGVGRGRHWIQKIRRMQKSINQDLLENEKSSMERVLGFVVKDKPSVETTQDILSKFKIFPHIVVSRRNSWQKGAIEILWTTFSLLGPVKPSEMIAQSVTIPVMMHTATEAGSFNLSRPCSAKNTSGATRAGLTNIPDFENKRARMRWLRKLLLSTKSSQ